MSAKVGGIRESRWSRLRIIPRGPLSPVLKFVLAGEIAASYVSTRRLRTGSVGVREIVRSIRSRPPIRAAAVEPGSLEARLVAARLGNAVHRTLRVLPGDPSCLIQSLVLSQLLSARAMPSTLVIGAHSRPDFAAHAWVEYEGRSVLPSLGFDESRLLEL
jgi:Transglutaminase-like superfamily